MIGAKTGEIRTSSIPLNRELKQFYKLQVTATDPDGFRVCNLVLVCICLHIND